MQSPMTGGLMTIGDWQADPAANRLTQEGAVVDVEPRVMDLLMLLACHAGKVVAKEEIATALWGDVHVNDDALTRTVFKLRKALGDDARDARYIETVSKRGYRLVAEVASPAGRGRRTLPARAVAAAVVAVLIMGGLLVSLSRSSPEPTGAQAERLMRADGFYSQFTRANNEAALRLYERVLEDEPENAAAMAGLANALTQRLVRYAGTGGDETGRTSLTEAIESGALGSDKARAGLERATTLARQATEADPSHARAWRALGLALAARQDFEEAERAYERALVIDPEDWGTMINLSELYELTGRPERSTPYLEQAWFAMERGYAADPVAIRPWHSSVGLAVAEDKVDAGALQEAETWYRRVLALDPLNAEAVRGLAGLLRGFGDAARADALCLELESATGERC